MRSSPEETKVNTLPCPREIFGHPQMLYIIFQYASFFFSSTTLPRSLMASQGMDSYKSFLEKNEAQTRNRISVLSVAKKRIGLFQSQAKTQLDNDIEEIKNKNATKLESDIQNQVLQYKRAIKDNDAKESEQARDIKQALLSDNNHVAVIISELIGMLEEFERLLIAELNNKSFWSRIKIDRDPDYDRRICNALTIFVVTAILVIIVLAGIVVLCASLLIPAVVNLLPPSIFLKTYLAGCIGGLIVAGINGLFKFDTRGNERFNQDSLASFSPAIVEKFEEVKAAQSIFMNDDDDLETSLATVSTQSTLSVVRSAFGRNLFFFKQLEVEQTTKEEKSSTLTPNLNNNLN